MSIHEYQNNTNFITTWIDHILLIYLMLQCNTQIAIVTEYKNWKHPLIDSRLTKRILFISAVQLPTVRCYTRPGISLLFFIGSIVLSPQRPRFVFFFLAYRSVRFAMLPAAGMRTMTKAAPQLRFSGRVLSRLFSPARDFSFSVAPKK